MSTCVPACVGGRGRLCGADWFFLLHFPHMFLTAGVAGLFNLYFCVMFGSHVRMVGG